MGLLFGVYWSGAACYCVRAGVVLLFVRYCFSGFTLARQRAGELVCMSLAASAMQFCFLTCADGSRSIE